MANSSDDLADKMQQDFKKRVKFVASSSNNNKQHENQSSTSGSGGEEENDDGESSQTFTNQSSSSYAAASTSTAAGGGSSSRRSKKRAVWELLEGYRDKNAKISKPMNYEGILLKRRNWPMKGWHKRYFILADGILSYGKSKSDMTKNKVHGTINAFLSIVSYSTGSRRILIDYSTQSTVFVCHLKARTSNDFDAWIDSLRQHRLYYQYKCLEQSSFLRHSIPNGNSTNTSINNNNNNNNNNSSNNNNHSSRSVVGALVFSVDPKNSSLLNTSGNIKSSINNTNQRGIESDNSTYQLASSPSKCNSNNNTVSFLKQNSIENNVSSAAAVTLNESMNRNLEIINQINANKKLMPADDNIIENVFKSVEDNLMGLSKLLSSLYFQSLVGQQQQQQQTAIPQSTMQASGGNNLLQPPQFQPQHSHQASSSSFDFLTMFNNMNASQRLHNSKSNPNLMNNEINTQSLNPTVIVTSNSSSNGVVNNKDNSPKLVSRDSQSNISSNSSGVCGLNLTDDATFRVNFYQGAKSINEQLIYIYQQLLLKKQTLASSNIEESLHSLHRGHRSQSVMSSVSLQDSQLQFYDAIEDFTSDSDTESESDQDSDVEVASSRKSSKKPTIVPEELQAQKILNRRRKLPATSPDTSQVSMWNILRKAIGKDLSKISLPVILNEPISILQRLCEELEYSDLLDAACGLAEPHDRMVYVAAFVISGYASSNYRTGAKNFNPLLGETYECSRPDKGWKYLAEQVSHHPPVSACHCSSNNFTHEQIFQAKVKFWGKSMEVHPEGYSRVTLAKFNETYQWNKIVMYVHNVMGSGRKIEHYGEISIRCTNGTSCTITFPKASYSSQKNEFYGDVVFENVVKRKIFGQWHEAFLCGMDNTAKTIWRMGAMPEDSHFYYGFTRFAIELNEFTEDLKSELPPTDTRFRPDQRCLENGQVEKAELEKHRIEEMQRMRRKDMEARGLHHQPLWFAMQDSEWSFNGQYWTKRENQGFKAMKSNFPNLW